MKPVTIALLAVLVVATLLIGRVIAGRQAGQASSAPPTGLASGGVEILEAQPFVVDQPFVHEWRAEKPLVSAGYLLVLEVDPELARTRQTYEPVLYVGAETAERCNAPIAGNVMIVLVPAPLDEQGRVALDLGETPIWFGSLELPERVDASRIARELELARARDIGAAALSAQARAGSAAEAIRARTREELQPYIEDLIQRYGQSSPLR